MYWAAEIIPISDSKAIIPKQIFSEIGIISAAQYKFMNSDLNTKYLLVYYIYTKEIWKLVSKFLNISLKIILLNLDNKFEYKYKA